MIVHHLRQFACAVLSVLFVSAAAPSRAQEKTVSIYTMQLKPTFTDYMTGVLKDFEAKNPGVKVDWIDVPAQDYVTKLLSLVLNDRAPDVMNLTYEYMANLKDKNQLLALDDLVTPEQRALYLDSIVQDGCRIDGKLYALPWYLSTQVIMYNREIFEKAGINEKKPIATSADLFATMRQVKEKAGTFGMLAGFTEDGALKTMLAAEGIPVVDAAGNKALFNTPEAHAFLGEYKKLFDEGVIPRQSITAQHREAIDMFRRERTSLLISGPQFLKLVKSDAPKVYEKVGVMQNLPIGNTGKFSADIQSLSLYAKTKHPKEARDLMLHVTNAQNQLELAKIVTIFPSVKAALADPYFNVDPNKADASPEEKARAIGRKQMETGTVLLPPLRKLSELNKVMNDAASKIMLKNVPVPDALGEAATKWNEILGRP